MSGKQAIPPIVRLRYHEGEQVFKAGDYGTSVYKIIRGEVDLFTVSGGIEVVQASLEAGEIVGETAFIGQGVHPNPISAKAARETVIEVWHIAHLMAEFDKLSPLLRFILKQPMSRLQRTRKLISLLSAKNVHRAPSEDAPIEELPPEETLEKEEDRKTRWAEQRRQHYRKELDVKCVYRPVSSKSDVQMTAMVRDISRGGVGLEVDVRNMHHYPHDIGDEFRVAVVLPDALDIHFVAKLLHIKRTAAESHRFFGMSITHIGYESQKRLGFFLMP